MAATRILVHLQNVKNNEENPKLANFTQVNLFNTV